MSREKVSSYKAKDKNKRTKSYTRKSKKRTGTVPHNIRKELKNFEMVGEKQVWGFRDAGGRLIGSPFTVIQDRTGNLNVWEGLQGFKKGGISQATLNTSDQLIQHDVSKWLQNVPKEAKEEIENGYTTFVMIMD